MRKTLLSSALVLALPATAHADFLGFHVGAAMWQHEPSGSVQYRGDEIDAADRTNGLGLSDNTDAMIWAAFEHPIPLIPNVKLMSTSVSSSGAGNLQAQFANVGFNEPVTSDLVLDQVDGVLYWELLDNWVELDVGLQVKMIDGSVSVVGENSGAQQTTFSATVPMGYAKVAFNLPFTGLSVGVEASAISYDGNSLSDVLARVSYETSIGLGAVVGYRQQNIKLDDVSGVTADISLEGPYAGLFFHF